jgi:hypothetical protein
VYSRFGIFISGFLGSLQFYVTSGRRNFGGSSVDGERNSDCNGNDAGCECHLVGGDPGGIQALGERPQESLETGF